MIHNVDETSVLEYVPRKILPAANETNLTGIKDMKESFTVLTRANAAGNSQIKNINDRKSASPRCIFNFTCSSYLPGKQMCIG